MYVSLTNTSPGKEWDAPFSVFKAQEDGGPRLVNEVWFEYPSHFFTSVFLRILGRDGGKFVLSFAFFFPYLPQRTARIGGEERVV